MILKALRSSQPPIALNDGPQLAKKLIRADLLELAHHGQHI